MRCVVCGKDEGECFDYGVYEWADEMEAMVCTEHQPLAEVGRAGSLEHTKNLDLLRRALKMTWAEVDKPKGDGVT